MPAELPNRTTTGSRSGDAFNKLRENARSHQPISAPGVLTSHTVHGVSFEADVSSRPYGEEVPESGSPVEMFVLKSCGTGDDADLLVCRTWDGESEGVTDVYIYKPFKLRNISIRLVGGNTITYTWDATYLQRTAFLNAGAGSIAEAQTIVPRYITPYTGYAGDVIHAGKLKYAQTVNLRTIEYVDLNVDGRAWAKSYA